MPAKESVDAEKLNVCFCDAQRFRPEGELQAWRSNVQDRSETEV